MKNKKINKQLENDSREIYYKVEKFCSSKFATMALVCLMIYSFVKVDSSFIRVMRQSYAQVGLVDTYVREEPIRTPHNLVSEIRLTTTSGA